LPIAYRPNIQDVPGGKANFLGGHDIGHSKHKYVQNIYTYMSPILNGFRDRAISLYSSKIFDKRYYVLYLIFVFIVQVTKLVQFT
jgi:hypothetical protein